MSYGDFVWYDYLAADVDKAIAFYTAAIGWEVRTSGEDHMWMLDEDTVVGGVRDLPEELGASSHWMSFVAVEDVEATIESCKELGGRVITSFERSSVGQFAILEDTDGAMFGAASFEAEMERPDPSQPGAFNWCKLLTSECQRAFDFYSALFGWDRGDTMDTHLGPATYQLFRANGNLVGGMMNRPEGMRSEWRFGITTDDFDAAGSRIVRNGGVLVDGPKDLPDGARAGAWEDDQGGRFGLHQPKG